MLKFRNVILLLFILGTAFALPPPSPSTSKISSVLQSRLQNGRANIFVIMSEKTSQVLQTVTQTSYVTREQRLNSLHNLLINHAERTQKSVLEYLASASLSTKVDFKSFWINNQIFVRDAELSLVGNLSRFPEVESIIEEFHAHIFEPKEVNIATKTKKDDDDDVEWGVRRIQAPEAWKELEGFTETEIRIATLNTGVRFTHETLKNNFLGRYGWYDATSRAKLQPDDEQGHGTHTIATIVGSKGVGVAPMAKWMSCRACINLGCFPEALLSCGQFFLCPTLADGSEPDCSKAPHLISNSWGGVQGQTYFNEVIDAWQTAGIIPVFSVGNNGSYFCASANYPGDKRFGVISVGSTDENETLSWFSSVGPSIHGDMKPEVVGPGHYIISATNTGDEDYAILSGTSMSTPHASGIIALLLTRNPNLTFEEAKDLLTKNTDQNLGSTGRVCGDIPDTEYPNHVFGHGRINALKSVRALAVQMEQRS